MRWTPVKCDELEGHLGAVAAGEVVLPVDSRRHVEGCLRCQAELIQHRSVLRTLRSLRHDVLEPADGLLPEILANIEHAGERHALRSLLNRHRTAYIVGLAVAGTAGATGAALLAVRARRTRHLAG